MTIDSRPRPAEATSTPLAESLRPATSSTSAGINRWFERHWLLALNAGWGIFVILPWFAPIFMALGLTWPGRAVYFIYNFFCHQLPERSWFLFGPQFSYTQPQIAAAWGVPLQAISNELIRRQFIGTAELGWKVAWSDRMVSMYTSTFLFGLLWWPFRKRVKSLPWWGLILFLIPMGVDGTTHFLSDFAGLGQGFRYSNLWLAAITNHALPASFCAGDALGSFNSWMRLLTGILFGMGVVWFGFPYLDDFFSEQAGLVESKRHPKDIRDFPIHHLPDL